jgi:hypothetical protein
MARAGHDFLLRRGLSEARARETAPELDKPAHRHVRAGHVSRGIVLCVDGPRVVDPVTGRLGKVVDGEAGISR